MNEPREYKNSVFYTLLVIIVIWVSIFALLAVIGVEQAGFIMLPLAGVLAVFSAAFLYMAASGTVVSEDEISSKTMFGTQTLKWSEIVRISGSGYAIKLHNVDGNTAVTISPRRPGYEEIVELIGVKRPDLFNQQEYSQIRGSLLKVLAQLLGGLSLTCIGAIPFFVIGDYSRDVMLSFIVVMVVGFVIIGMALFAPWSISIQGKSIMIGYLFSQKTLTAEEISSIYLGYGQTRRGHKNYYVQISKKGGNAIRISSFKPSLPIAYLVLKNWHRQNA